MPPERRRVLITMCLALATVVSTVASLNVALPDLARDTGATQTQIQWIVDAYALVFAGLLLPAGALGDRIGRRRILLLGLAIFGLASAAATLIDQPDALIAVRATMGLGAALIMPTTLSVITSSFGPGERDRAVAIWAGVAGGSALLGLLVSGAVLEVFSWPSIFVLNVVLAGLAATGTVRFVHEGRAAERPPLDAGGAVLSALALTAIVWAVIEGPQRGWGDVLVVGGFAAGIALGAAFVGYELRREQPMLDPRLFLLRGFGAGSLSLFVQFFGMFGFIFVLLQYVQFVLGYSPLEAGIALAPMGVVLIGVSSRVPRLIDRFGVRRVGPPGLAIAGGGMAILSTLGPDASYWHLLAGLLVLGFGLALATTPATTAIVESVPAEKQGVASAVNDASREVGGALGIAVLGSVLAATYSSSLGDALAGSDAPAEAVARAQESLPAAMAIAERIGPRGADLAIAAGTAFSDGLSVALLVAAAVMVAGALVVYLRGPRSEVATCASVPSAVPPS
jgi:EmrB/QacA subfamily drug resistance transporter